MKKTYLLIIFLGIVAFALAMLDSSQGVTDKKVTSASPTPSITTPSENTINDTTPLTTIIAANLDTPWGIVFLPKPTSGEIRQSMLVTERRGTIRLINDGKLNPLPVATIAAVREVGEGGLMGIALHPKFSINNFVYLYYTYSGANGNTLNRVVRMTYEHKTLTKEQIIVNAIPGAANHNGGRIKFGPDNYLYIGTGDAQAPSEAQNTNSLAGKILRVTDSGQPAPDNPFGDAPDKPGNSMVYSYGHRNVQGLTWDSTGQLWATEHGPSGTQSGNDEINRILRGENYGWPNVQGDQVEDGMIPPVRHSGRTETWAPGGAAYYKGSVFFVGLRGETLYEAVVKEFKVSEIKRHFKGEFGRLRDVVVGPDNMVYVTTSNQDGRGTPSSNDDRIIRINPSNL